MFYAEVVQTQNAPATSGAPSASAAQPDALPMGEIPINLGPANGSSLESDPLRSYLNGVPSPMGLVNHEMGLKEVRKRSTAQLLANVENPFWANSRNNMQRLQRDWGLFESFVFSEVGGEKVIWPPDIQSWTRFLIWARPKVTSYKRFQQCVHDICSVGMKLNNDLAKKTDPRKIFKARYRETMRMLAREYKVAVNQVEGISLSEAKDGTEFVGDRNSIKELCMAASFALGCISGRRAEALVHLRVRDIRFLVDRAFLSSGVEVFVPGVELKLPKEKFEDQQGPRSVYERYVGFENYELWMLRGCSRWLYEILVIRGAFVGQRDPI